MRCCCTFSDGIVFAAAHERWRFTATRIVSHACCRCYCAFNLTFRISCFVFVALHRSVRWNTPLRPKVAQNGGRDGEHIRPTVDGRQQRLRIASLWSELLDRWSLASAEQPRPLTGYFVAQRGVRPQRLIMCFSPVAAFALSFRTAL